MKWNYSNFIKCHCWLNLTSMSFLCFFQLINCFCYYGSYFLVALHAWSSFLGCQILWFLTCWVLDFVCSYKSWASSRDDVNLLGNSWILLILLLQCVRWNYSSAQCKSNSFSWLRRDSPVCSTSCPCPVKHEIFHSSLQNLGLFVALYHVWYPIL